MLYNSAMELDTGVPVANTMLLPCPASRRYSHLSNRSSHFCAAATSTPGTLIVVAMARFLYWWASSTNSMSTPRSSKSIHSLLSPLSRSAWSLPSTRMRSFSACLTVLPRFFSILPISSFSFFAEKSLLSDFAVSMLSSISALRRSKYFSRRSGLTCMRWNVSCRTMTASQSPAATLAQKRAAPLPVPSASVMDRMFASG